MNCPYHFFDMMRGETMSENQAHFRSLLPSDRFSLSIVSPPAMYEKPRATWASFRIR